MCVYVSILKCISLYLHKPFNSLW